MEKKKILGGTDPHSLVPSGGLIVPITATPVQSEVVNCPLHTPVRTPETKMDINTWVDDAMGPLTEKWILDNDYEGTWWNLQEELEAYYNTESRNHVISNSLSFTLGHATRAGNVKNPKTQFEMPEGENWKYAELIFTTPSGGVQPQGENTNPPSKINSEQRRKLKAHLEDNNIINMHMLNAKWAGAEEKYFNETNISENLILGDAHSNCLHKPLESLIGKLAVLCEDWNTMSDSSVIFAVQTSTYVPNETQIVNLVPGNDEGWFNKGLIVRVRIIKIINNENSVFIQEIPIQKVIDSRFRGPLDPSITYYPDVVDLEKNINIYKDAFKNGHPIPIFEFPIARTTAPKKKSVNKSVKKSSPIYREDSEEEDEEDDASRQIREYRYAAPPHGATRHSKRNKVQ